MKRRWFIRIVFMLPILLCLAGWGWSGTHHGVIAYRHNGRNVVGCDSFSGIVIVNYGWYGEARYNGWYYEVNSTATAHFWPKDAPHFQYVLGFGFRQLEVTKVGDGTVTYIYDLAVPFWFFIVVFSAVLFFVWRKTRPKINPKSAFPVELDKPTAEQMSKAI